MTGVAYSGTYATPRADLGEAFQEYIRDAETFIATKVLPIVPTLRQAGAFSKMKRSSMLRAADVKRAPGGTYNRVQIEAVDDTYSCKERGLEGVVDHRQRSFYANDFDLEMSTMEQVAMKILLQQEIDVAAMIQDPTTSWPSGDAALYTNVSAAPWDTAASDVIAHIVAAKNKVRTLTGIIPDTLVLSELQFQNLLVNDGVQASFPGAPVVTEEMIMANIGRIFGLKKILRGKAVRNTASQGSAESISDVWSDDYALICKTADEGDGILAPCIGRTMLWTPESPSELVVEEYESNEARAKIIRVRHDTDEELFDPAFGHLLKID